VSCTLEHQENQEHLALIEMNRNPKPTAVCCPAMPILEHTQLVLGTLSEVRSSEVLSLSLICVALRPYRRLTG